MPTVTESSTRCSRAGARRDVLLRATRGVLSASMAAVAMESVDAAAPMPALRHAVAMHGCTQEDSSAIEIVLTPQRWAPPEPLPATRVRIEVAGAGAGLAGTLELSPLRRETAARTFARAELHRPGSDAGWLTGRLRLDYGGARMPVKGSYTFCAAEWGCFEGSFEAAWTGKPVVCGG